MHKRTEVARVLGAVASQRIWRTVVFAGAMLGGAAACGGKSGDAETMPKVEPAAEPVAPADPAAADPAATTPTDPAMANPCGGGAAANPCGAAANPCGAASANPCGASADPCSGGEANPCGGAAETPTKKRPRGKSSKPTGRGFVLA
jgi:hypothetical protein